MIKFIKTIQIYAVNLPICNENMIESKIKIGISFIYKITCTCIYHLLKILPWLHVTSKQKNAENRIFKDIVPSPSL